MGNTGLLARDGAPPLLLLDVIETFKGQGKTAAH
jgi:hypothetical protein